MKRGLLVAAVLVTLVSGAGLVAASAAGPASGGPASGGPGSGVPRPGNLVEVRLTIRHSRFVPAAINVPAGATIRFVVDNTDPINHELILGDQAVQDKHETGTETHHGSVPGEISVDAGKSASTTYTFGGPGEVLMGCHLPGHWTYGMQAVVSVV